MNYLTGNLPRIKMAVEIQGRIFLGLGSNIGDRFAYMQQAITGLQSQGFETQAKSALYETPPWGLKEQPPFINQVIEGRFSGSPMDLLAVAMQVEAEVGRERLLHWGPRVLDIDVLAIGQEKIVSQRLTVPHPFAKERAFVLVPWAEIAPEFILPGEDMAINELLALLPEAERTGIKKL